MSGKNLLCSHGQHIGEQQECEEAAKYLQLRFKDARNKNMFPKGCYFLHQTTRMYFNTHAWGKAEEKAEQICKSEKTQGMKIFIPSFKFHFTIDILSQANFIINLVEYPRIQELFKIPKLKFFKSKSVNVDYIGAQSLGGLTVFINEQMGGETATKKGIKTICLSIFLRIFISYEINQ